MMSQADSNQQNTWKEQQNRIIWRRIAPIVIVVFVAFALIGVVQTFNAASDRQQVIHQTVLDEISQDLQRELDRVNNEVRDVVSTRAVQVLVESRIIDNLGLSDDTIYRVEGIVTLQDLLSRRPIYSDVTLYRPQGNLVLRMEVVDGTPIVTAINRPAETDGIQNTAPFHAAVTSSPGQTSYGGFEVTEVDGEPAVTFAIYAPLYNVAGEVTGVIRLTTHADTFLSVVNNPLPSLLTPDSSGRVLLFADGNRVLADSGAESNDYLLPLIGSPTNTDVVAVYQRAVDFYNVNPGDTNLIASGNDVFTVRAVLTGTSVSSNLWTLIFVDDAAAVWFTPTVSSIAVIGLAVLLAAIVIFWFSRNMQELYAPITQANTFIQQLISGDPVDTKTPLDVSQTDSIMQSIEQVAGRIQKLNIDMTQTMQRRDRDLKMVADIGRKTATLQNIDEILNLAIELICTELDFYHAQVFLIDDARVNAVLVHSRGETGRQMLERRHQIRIGSPTIIGTVTGENRAIFINDTKRVSPDMPHGHNPLLRDTKSELGLPLNIGNEIIGALDIQSKETNAFHEADLPVYQLLADQLAIAIHNAQLTQQASQRVRQIDTLNRQLTRSAWEEAQRGLNLQRYYEYNLLDITTDESAEAAQKKGVSAPISIRGEVIGELSVSSEDIDLSENERFILNAVANRVALAIENARLFQETQTSLSETSTLYQLSQYLNEANTLDDIVRAITVSVMPDAAGGQVWLFEEYGFEADSEWLILNTHLTMTPEAADNRNVSGLRIRIEDHPFIEQLPKNRVTLIHDVREDVRLDNTLRNIFAQFLARAVVLIPLTVRTSWRGFITVTFAESRIFSEQEGRIYSALISQAGVAIDNRMLLRQTAAALERNENLYAASRIINTAQNLQDLVYAVVATSNTPQFDYWLSLMEGELDDTGWSTTARIVARSEGGTIIEEDIVHPLHIPADSPIRKREPAVYIDHDPENPDAPPNILWIRAMGYRLVTAFGLFSDNRPIATFFIGSHEAEELSAEDYEVYRALTGQMSTQIENRRLLQRTEQALDETRRLYIASSAIASAQDAEGVYNAAAIHLSRALHTDTPQKMHISLHLASPEPTITAPHLETVYAWSNDASVDIEAQIGMMIEQEKISFGTLLQANDGSVHYPDLQTNLADNPALQALLMQDNARNAVIASIQSRQKWFGILLIKSDHTHSFDDQFQRFVQNIASQVAIAVENNQLFQEAQTEAQRAQTEARRALALAEAGQLANRIAGDFETNIGEVIGHVAQSADYTRWMLFLTDDETGTLEKITDHAVNMEPLAIPMRDIELSVSNAYHLNQMIRVNDPLDYPAFRSLEVETRETIAHYYGKHIVAPIRNNEGAAIGVMLVGRDQEDTDLDERDEQFATTLAAQVAVAVENRRLFRAAEEERRNLQSILTTMPTGVLVLDPETLHPINSNDQVVALLGKEIDLSKPFQAADYNLYRTGTNLHYPDDELPIKLAMEIDQSMFVDDVAVITDDYQIDLLMNAAPIHDTRGHIIGIVTAFQDISNLRGLENTLQENLRETVALYEAQRALSEAEQFEDVLDVMYIQLALQQPANGFVITIDDVGHIELARSLDAPIEAIAPLVKLLDPEQTIHIEDVANNTLVDEAARDVLTEHGYHTLISVPLRTRVRDIPFGWLVAVETEPYAFTADQERILETLGDLARTALDNRYLFQSTQEALQATATLYTATSTASRASDLEQLSDALRTSLETLRPDMYAAYIIREDRVDTLFNAVTDPNDPLIDFTPILRYELAQGDGVFIGDISRSTLTPLEKELIKLGDISAFAAVNLRIKDWQNGRIIVAYKESRKFSDNDVRLLNALADSASVVVDNQMLFDQLQGTLEETSTLYQTSRALTDTDSPEDILDVVVNFLIEPHVNQVFIALLDTKQWDTPGATVEVVSSWNAETGMSLTGISLTADQFPAWRQLSTSQVLTIDDIHTDPDLDDMERIGIESLDARSLVVMPLRSPTREIGAIWIGSNEPYVHSEREVRIYQAFQEQASLSMEAAHLLEQTERRASQLETSARVSQRAAQILNLDELLPQIVDEIQQSFGYHHVQIFMMNEDTGYAELRASTGEAGEQLLGIKHKLARGSDSVIGQVTLRGEPTIALDTADADVIHQPNPYLPLTRSEMALPLIVKGSVVGALDVQSNQPNAFNEEDVRALTTLAAQIAVAIDNSNLYQETQRRASDMTFLFDVTNIAAAAETLDEALQSVAGHLHDSLKALVVGIYLPSVYADTLGTGEEYTVLQPIAISGTRQPISEIAEVRLDTPNNMLVDVATTLEPMVINHIEDESTYLPIASEARSALIMPISTGNELVGLLVMEDHRRNAYDENVFALVLTLVGSLAAIIQNVVLVDELTATNEQLLELDRLKSDFLANMSHELRTPLNSIIGFSRVMLKGIDGPLTEMQEQDLTTIYNSGQHLLMLINDVLDQAKIAANKMDLKLDYFEAKPLVEAVKSIAIGLLKEKSVQLIVEIAPNLPKAFGDEFRTRQVLLNLVNNAVKFTPEGSITIRSYLTKSEKTGADMLRIDVADTGIGIEEKNLPLLFEAFQQIDSSLTRTVGGTGLGLPIAKSLTEMQGGEMFVESQINVGSTFSIIIPIEPAESEEEADALLDESPDTPINREAAQQTVEVPIATTNGGSNGDTAPTEEEDKHPTVQLKRPPIKPKGGAIMPTKREILLIEDDKNMVDQFRRSLQREGFEIQTADHPSYAEAMASNMRPTLILMDVDFAEGKGWDILQSLMTRDDTFDIPVIVVTLNDDIERAQDFGAYAVVQRPFMPEELVEVVLAAEKEGNRERILIIDDQPESIRLIKELLNEHGNYRVFTAENANEGIALVARRRPNLIILDLRMPEKDGFAVLNELRSNPETSDIPVMVVTNANDLNADEQAQLANIHVLEKTSISQEAYDHFITGIQTYLTSTNGGN